MPRIFISYSRSDQDFATQLAAALSNGGADVWIDVEDIPAGMKWSSAIQEGLDTSDALLVVVSPEAMASRNVEDEWQYFLDHQRPILTVRHRPAKMHYQLNRIQYIDFHNQVFEAAFFRLVAELDRANVRGINAPKPPTPPARPTRPTPAALPTRPVALNLAPVAPTAQPSSKPTAQSHPAYQPPVKPSIQSQAVSQTEGASFAKTAQRPKSEPKVARPMPPLPPSDRLERFKQPPPTIKSAQPWWKSWAVWGVLVMLLILVIEQTLPLFQR